MKRKQRIENIKSQSTSLQSRGFQIAVRCFIAILWLSPQLAVSQNRNISLKEILQTAATSPEVRSAKSSANEASETATSVWRRTYMPKLSGTLGYTHLLENEALTIPPIGPVVIPPQTLGPDFVSGSVQLSQSLFDPANMLFRSKAIEILADAEKLRSSRQIKETQGKAINYYLQILEFRARRGALEKFVVNLRSRQTEIKRLYELGSVSDSDVLKVKLGIDDANQSIREILLKESYLGKLLASVLGESGVRWPEELPADLPETPPIEAKMEIGNREDVRAIDKQLESIDLSRRADKAEYIPKVAASLQHFYTNTTVLSNQNVDAVGVQLIWSIYDGGVDFAKASASAEKRQALEQKRVLTVSSIQASYEDAIQMLKTKKIEYMERQQSLIEAKRVTDIEFRRLKVGKTTVNNLIDAEDVLKDRMEKTELSKTNWYQAWFSHLLASGEELRTP